MRLAVVGGGMAGLAAAWEAERVAEREGLDLSIVLHESSDRLGGKVWTVRENGFVVEGGADAVVRYKPWALELAGELGLETLGTLPSRPAALIVRHGRAYPLPAGLNLVAPGRLAEFARSPLLSARGKARALADLVLPRGPGADETFGSFVTRRFGRELWDGLAAPLAAGIYGGDAYELSTEAAFPQLLELESRERSLIFGSRRLLRARAAGEGGASLFASFAGGLGTLAEATAAALSRTELRLGTPVMELARVEADAVVLAVPAHAAAEILAGEVPEAATVLRAIPYADAVSVTLAFPAAGFPPLEGHGLLFAAGEGKSVRGFTWVHRKWPERAPPGTPLVRAFFDENQAGRPDEELVALARGTLEDLVGTVPEHERVWTFRWPDGLPQYTMGHPARMRSLAAALARLPHVRVAGAAYRGIGVPDVVRDGRDAARAALASLDRRRSS